MKVEEMKAAAQAAKEAHPMTEAYDVKVLGQRLKAVGVDVAEEALGKVYFVNKEWAKESAPLSSNKIDDVAAPFYDQADQFVIPQIDKINSKKDM